MLVNIIRLVHRPVWLVQITLAMLALLIIAVPASAAGPQVQEMGASVESVSMDAGTVTGDSGTQDLDQPDVTCPAGGQCFADVTSSNNFYAYINRIYLQGLVTGYACGGVNEPCDSQNRPYYRPSKNVNRQSMAKFIDNARRLPQIHLDAATTDPLIYARNTQSASYAIYAETSSSGSAVYGKSTSANSGNGVSGNSPNGFGVSGASTDGVGTEGFSINLRGLQGTSNNGDGVYGSGGTAGYAGHFIGDVYVTGHVTAVGGCCTAPELSTRIDDPLDPANKYLNESVVQSPDMTTVINGNVTLDGKGEAVVSLPSWFQVANRDYRYTLTAVGAPGPNLYIAQELSGDQFRIAGGKADGKVSWQVTGIRQDAYANAHPVNVEQDKPANEQGKYLHPTENGQPASLGVDYVQKQKAQQEIQERMLQLNENRP